MKEPQHDLMIKDTRQTIQTIQIFKNDYLIIQENNSDNTDFKNDYSIIQGKQFRQYRFSKMITLSDD